MITAQHDLTSPISSRRGFSPAFALAVLAVPLISYQLWMIGGWLADGLRQITEYRDHGSTSWYAAHIQEVIITIAMVFLIRRIVRESRAAGHLTTDALMFIGITSAAFWDPVYNWIGPAWFYTSNFVNLNDWFANAPLVGANDAVGHQPWAVFPTLIGYAVWGVGFAQMANHPMQALRDRRPQTSAGLLALIALVISVAITAVAFWMDREFGLMAAPGFRLPIFGDNEVLVAALSGGIVFWAFACVRFFKDKNGDSVIESGIAGVRHRTLTAVLASMALCQSIVIIGWGVLSAPLVLGASEYPSNLPAHLVNGACDLPGKPMPGGSFFGPCPGSPGSEIGGSR